MLDIPDTPAINKQYQPNLSTIRMVENFIKENSGEFKKKALWQNLPKKMMYQTYCNVIDYLLESNKIAMDSKGFIVWIWDPEVARKYLLRDDLAIK